MSHMHNLKGIEYHCLLYKIRYIDMIMVNNYVDLKGTSSFRGLIPMVSLVLVSLI